MDQIPVFEKFDLTKSDQPYENYWEYYREYTHFIHLKLFYLYKEILKDESTSHPKLMGLVVTKEEFEKYMKHATKLTAFSGLSEEEHSQLEIIWNYMQLRKNKSTELGITLPPATLAKYFGLSPMEESCITLLFICEMDKKYEKILMYLQDDVNKKMPTIGTLLNLLAPPGHKVFAYLSIFEDTSALVEHALIHMEPKAKMNAQSRMVQLNRQIFNYLMDPAAFKPRSPHIKEYFCPAVVDTPASSGLIFHEEHFRTLSETLTHIDNFHQKTLLLHLHGNSGIGKKFTLKQTLAQLQASCLFIDIHTLLKSGEDFLTDYRELLNEAVLLKAYICLLNYENLFETIDNKLHYHIHKTILINRPEYGKVLFVMSSDPLKLHTPADMVFMDISFAKPDALMRCSIWNALSEGMTFDENFNMDEIAGKFQFTTGQIKDTINEACYKARLTGQEIIKTDVLYQCAYRQMNHKLSEKATLIKPAYSWSDIILPDSQIKTLKQACNHIVYKSKVYSDWQFSTKFNYGQGLSMLFSGPPGTGKTMAAQIIANALHMEMYKIQLSQIVSKYIGETEKNLRHIFEEAKNSNVILFFDETDALFGKRSEVKDSHDRYANIETAFLLQQVEEHDGVIIMATNFLQNIDEAFMRRISFVIHFPFPDAHSRRQIWKTLIPSAAPIEKNIDFDFLAEKFEVSGGHIKNIIISAAFMAASQNRSITMSHLLSAAIHELKKNNKIIIKEDLSEYAYLLDE